ncbi:MAG: asparaginase [Candidatus Limnocylindrales bacterium]
MPHTTVTERLPVAPARPPRPSRATNARARYPRGAAAPALLEVRRGPIVESRHRGHVLQVDVQGRLERGVGDPDHVAALRSAVKPFAVAAMLESGAAEAFELTPTEIAVMTASHDGEDAHVRTLQGVLRRSALTQTLLACGFESAPLDPRTAARLAREGEAPGQIRQMCSGFHVASLLLARHAGWSLADYWRPEHPSQMAVRDVIGRIFGVKSADLVAATDNCGVQTYAFSLTAIARAFCLLADPQSVADEARKPLVPTLTRIRDAMVGHPEMVGGTHESTDTKLMRARPRMLVCKTGAEGLRGIGLLPGARGAGSPAVGIVVKIEDGDGKHRANKSVTVEALAQLGALDEAALHRLDEVHHPGSLDPRGVDVATTVPVFELAPLSELG